MGYYNSIEEIFSSLSPQNLILVKKLRELLLKYGAKEELKSIHICYKFPNKMRFYVNTYKKKFPIFSCNGYYIFQKYPMLDSLFDARAKYIVKIFIKNEETFQHKAIEQLIKLVSSLEVKKM